MPPDLRRLRKELLEASADPNDVVKLFLKDENDLTRMSARFPGPEGTPYEAGTFVLDIEIPDNYPFAPPKMKFATPVYHPNVSSQTGAICLDTLQAEWTPVLNLKATVLSVQQLLLSPEPDDPQDALVAQHMKTDPDSFRTTARHWTHCYACAGTADDWTALGYNPETVRELTSMGFEESDVLKALKQTQGSMDQAVELLLVDKK